MDATGQMPLLPSPSTVSRDHKARNLIQSNRSTPINDTNTNATTNTSNTTANSTSNSSSDSTAKVPTPTPQDESASPVPPTPKGKKRKRSSLSEDIVVAEDPYHYLDIMLAQKRKPRHKTACLSCRKRKVGCDKMWPCQNCIDRQHPEMCYYETIINAAEAPISHISVTTSSTNPSNHVSLSRSYLETLMAKVDTLQVTMQELKSEMKSISELARAVANGSSSTISSSNSSSHSSNGVTNKTICPPTIDPMMTGGAEASDEVQRRDGVHTNNPLTGQVIHVGGNSVPALLISLAKHQASTSTERNEWSELINGNIIPLLGLENEAATYPFIDLWSIPEKPVVRIQKLASVLPNNDEIDRLFPIYKTVSQAIFPAIANMQKFELHLMEFRYRRSCQSADNDCTDQTIHGKKISWLALLFAVLASAVHFSSHLNRSDRELTAKIYICCSFECLRMTNFLSNPTLDSIQALAVFLNVLLNMYNAGVSWAMLGLAIRLAQSLGLHRPCAPKSRQDNIVNERSRVWWALMWQDSIISVTYDRAGVAVHQSCESVQSLPPDVADLPMGTWPFDRCMFELCRISMNIVAERQDYKDIHNTMLRMTYFEKNIASILVSASASLRDTTHCISLEERCQHWLLNLHSSYVLCELYRPAISPGAPSTEAVSRTRESCIEHLSRVVRGWLGLFRVAPITNRSWPAMQRALSSALLLEILRETEHDQNLRYLLSEFLRALEEVTAGMGHQDIWAPIAKSIFWLRKLAAASGSDDKSPKLPDMGSNDSPHAMMERLMWQGISTTPSIRSST